ncbi:MAG: hypothetical protein M3Y36_11400, partial [Actinomycetota bacterium]|nr:hypothetical protein [Actinomycetota bacterium]
DQTAPRRDVADERQWRTETGRDPDPVLDERASQVDDRAATRDRWIAGNATRLARWDALGHALEQREDLLAHALAHPPGNERRIGATLDRRENRAPTDRRVAIETHLEQTGADREAGVNLGLG